MTQHHHHHHPTNDSSRNIRFAFFLNIGFTIIEIIGGILTNSVAILSDALHDLGDSVSLGLSWYFDKLSKKKRDQQYTYGYGRFSLLAAFINSVVLITGSIVIIYMAIPRILNPQQPDAQGMIFLAILGIVFNGLAVLRVKKGKSMNERVISWHLLEDVLGWVAVLLASIAMLFWNVPVLDPLLSLFFTFYILYNVYLNFRQTIRIFLQGKPENFDLEKLNSRFLSLKNLISLHDVHVWTMDGAYYVMTLHIVVKDDITNEEILVLKSQIRETCHQMEIEHVTIEVEFESEKCELQQC
ncbi:cation diffusion facilitator family transporter [soil metagenome]